MIDSDSSQDESDDSDARADALAALVVSERLTIVEAGERLGLSPATSYRVSGTIEYKRAKVRRLAEIADANIQTLIDAESMAIQCVMHHMTNEDANVSLAAAKAILSNSARASVTLERLIGDCDVKRLQQKSDSDFYQMMLESYRRRTSSHD